MIPEFDHLGACWRAEDLLQDPRFRRSCPISLPTEEEGDGTWCGLIEEVGRELETGVGAVHLRGLELGDEDEASIAAGFRHLTDALGTPLSQNTTGDTLLRVQDEDYAPDDPRYRGPSSRAGLSFHSDRCDVIAFLCVRQAPSGGESWLVSSVRLYERLRKEEPATLEVLCQAFPILRHTIDPLNPRPWVELPVFSAREGHFAGHLLRVLIDRADASPLAPDLSSAQRRALDRIASLADEEGGSLRLEPGDILLLNNWVTFHRRAAFEDDAEPTRKRLLFRRWLSVPGNRPLDERFAAHFGNAEADQVRGGIRASS